jgi:hypothetical protein
MNFPRDKKYKSSGVDWLGGRADLEGQGPGLKPAQGNALGPSSKPIEG